MKVIQHPAIVAAVRPLLAHENESLEADLIAHGCLDRLIYFKLGGVNVQGDGHHRRRLCDKHGIAYEWQEMKFDSLEDAVKWVKEHAVGRRNLTADESQMLRKARIERVVDAKVNGESIATIAEKEGVSKTQVRRDIEDGTEPGGAVEPKGGTVTGKDGKKRKPRGPNKPKTPKAESNGQAEKPPVEREIGDEPPEETIDEQIKRINSEIESFCRKLMHLVGEDLPKDHWLDDMPRGGHPQVQGWLRSLAVLQMLAFLPALRGDGK